MKMIRSVLRLVERYNKYTEQNPAKSIILSTGVLLGTGDILSQKIDHFLERRDHKGDANYQASAHNKSRSAHVLLYGLCLLGPFNYYWYTHALPRIAPITIQGCKSQLFKKVFIDQIVGCGIQYSSFLAAMTVLGGKSIFDEPEKFKQDFVQCCLSDVCVWPWVQYANFRYVPIHMQAVYVSVISVFWNAYISAIHHTPVEVPSQKQQAAAMLKTNMLAF